MPLYEYVCEQCQCKFELLRGFGRADELTVCPKCEAPGAHRVLSRFAGLSKGGDGWTSSIGPGSSCGSCGAGSCAGCKR